MKYITDNKWRPFKEDMDGLGFRYRGVEYSLDDFIRVSSHWLTTEFMEAPIKVHGAFYDSIQVVLIQVDECADVYKVCRVAPD